MSSVTQNITVTVSQAQAADTAANAVTSPSGGSAWKAGFPGIPNSGGTEASTGIMPDWLFILLVGLATVLALMLMSYLITCFTNRNLVKKLKKLFLKPSKSALVAAKRALPKASESLWPLRLIASPFTVLLSKIFRSLDMPRFKELLKLPAVVSIVALAVALPLLSLSLRPTTGFATSDIAIDKSDLIVELSKNDSTRPLTASVTSTIAINSDNPSGYSLTAKVDKPLEVDMVAAVNDHALSTEAASIYTSDTLASLSNYHKFDLTVAVPSTTPNGEYYFKLTYELTENPLYSTPPDPAKVTKITPNFASTVAPTGSGTGTNGPQFSIVGLDFGSEPVVTIDDKPCTDVSVNHEVSAIGTALTCTGPVAGLTDGEKRVTINGTDAGDDYTVYYSSYNFPTLQSVDSVKGDCLGTPELPVVYRDTRDSQLYFVAKLQDGKCWMLDNLKYKPNRDSAGTAKADFEAEQVWKDYLTVDGTDVGTDPNYDAAKYVDPIGLQGADYCYGNTDLSPENITKCGLLYNYYTATAGTGKQNLGTEDESIYGPEFSEAPGSICPANWRLPRGHSDSSDDVDPSNDQNDFAVLNGAMVEDEEPHQEASTAADEYTVGWQPDGFFRGVFSGKWTNEFVSQGSHGVFWSSTVKDATQAWSLSFSAESVDPASTDGLSLRDTGLAVRCVTGQYF